MKTTTMDSRKNPLRSFFFITMLSVMPFVVSAQSWNLVWSDEFNGNSIDATNWKFETGAGGWGNNELEYYTNRPENACINNGNLLIIARKEAYNGSGYTSARLKTQGLRNWTYGKMEARIKVNQTKGLWPAFWMLGESIAIDGWPKCGEIDILEHVNKVSNINGTIHWDNNGHAQYGGDTLCNVSQYHVYGIEWDANAIRWMLDGKKYWEANIKNNINSTNEFHAPFFFILNVAVGGNWPGSPDGTSVFPDTMLVDYVRVYQAATSVPTVIERISSVTLFPNPSNGNGTLHFSSAYDDKYNVSVINSRGQICYQQELHAAKNESASCLLNGEHLTRGLYVVKVASEEECIYLKWLIE